MKKSVPHEFKERTELSEAREEEEVGVRPPIRDTEMGDCPCALVRSRSSRCGVGARSDGWNLGVRLR
ncbi:hypothetical protein GW17_00039309, partial [Ensete ventricosum]